MKIMLVAGARPNFMKVASIVDAWHAWSRAGRTTGECVLVHTGQHYDEQMSEAFFKDLALPRPTVDLGVGSASHAEQTAEIMKRFEPVLLEEKPDAVLVVGDVNSTVGCSLVAAKVDYPATNVTTQRRRPLLIHVEAGLRSFDRSMPEEVNRVVTDALADILFVTEKSALANLRREGIPKEKVFFVGNTMVDTLLKHKEKARASTILERLNLVGSTLRSATADPSSRGDHSRDEPRSVANFALVTLHRPSNVDNPETLGGILDALLALSRDMRIVFPLHPRTRARLREFGFDSRYDLHLVTRGTEPSGQGIWGIGPLGYLECLCLMANARLVLTDSGGIQEETTVLGVPCVTLRENTERPVTITHGTNVLAGSRKADILTCASAQLSRSITARRPRYWDGRAGERIIRILLQEMQRAEDARVEMDTIHATVDAGRSAHRAQIASFRAMPNWRTMPRQAWPEDGKSVREGRVDP